VIGVSAGVGVGVGVAVEGAGLGSLLTVDGALVGVALGAVGAAHPARTKVAPSVMLDHDRRTTPR
jgi:hypothetical protein